ncbi:MAG: hypothetical protein PHC86_07055 [Eubacteriales bacterium]|nr:hypothetical protein [Eubacteriales bacterium]
MPLQIIFSALIFLVFIAFCALEALVLLIIKVKTGHFIEFLADNFQITNESQLQHDLLMSQKQLRSDFKLQGTELNTALTESIQKNWVPAVRNMSQSLEEAVKHLNDQQQHGMGKLAGHFARQLDQSLGEHLSALAGSIESINTLHEQGTNRTQELLTHLDKTIALQTETDKRVNEVLKSLADARQSIMDSSTQLNHVFSQSATKLTDAFDQSTDKLTDTFDQSTTKLTAAVDQSAAKLTDAFDQSTEMLTGTFDESLALVSTSFADGSASLANALKDGRDALQTTFISGQSSLNQTLLGGQDSLNQLLTDGANQLKQSYVDGAEQLNLVLVRSSEMTSEISNLLLNAQQEAAKLREDQVATESQISGYFDQMHNQINRLQDDLQANLIDIFAKFTDLTSMTLTQSEEKSQQMMATLSEQSTTLMNTLDDQVRELSFLVRDVSGEISGLNKTLDNSVQGFGEQLQLNTQHTFTAFDEGLTNIVAHLSRTIEMISDAVDDLPGAVASVRDLIEAGGTSDGQRD